MYKRFCLLSAAIAWAMASALMAVQLSGKAHKDLAPHIDISLAYIYCGKQLIIELQNKQYALKASQQSILKRNITNYNLNITNYNISFSTWTEPTMNDVGSFILAHFYNCTREGDWSVTVNPSMLSHPTHVQACFLTMPVYWPAF